MSHSCAEGTTAEFIQFKQRDAHAFIDSHLIWPCIMLTQTTQSRGCSWASAMPKVCIEHYLKLQMGWASSETTASALAEQDNRPMLLLFLELNIAAIYTEYMLGQAVFYVFN